MKKIFVFVLLFSVGNLFCQSNIDSLLNVLPEAKDTLRLQAIDKILSKVRGTDKVLAQQLISEEYELAAIINNEKFTAAVHNSNAIFLYFQNDLDSAIYYFEKSLTSFQNIGARDREAFLCNNIAILYAEKGDFEMAMDFNLKSLKIKEELGDTRGIANSKYTIANLWTELGDWDKAKLLFEESLALFESLDAEESVNDCYFGLGAIASNQKEYQLALDNYLRTLAYYKKIENGYMQMSCYNNIGQAYYNLEMLDSALYYYQLGQPMAIEFEDMAEQASLNRHIGDVYSAQGLHKRAVSLLEKSVNAYKTLGYKDQLSDSYQYLSEAQENAGQYEDAYYNMHNYIALRDSIASIQMQTDIIELETKYETEKKEKELVISRAENDKKQSRIHLLLTGLVSLFLLFSALYYAMRQRIKKNKLEKEKVALELKDAAQQLEFKKKELTAKALQLAKKNEFLQELETEVAELQSSIDKTVSKTSSRISRMIQRDTVDDEEWDQFGREFSSVHQDFLDRLRARYGSFSKGEMRLIALLRMNLTSKDIASTLRISDEGIKKARYRLRKKMELDPSEDLAGLIMGM